MIVIIGIMILCGCSRTAIGVMFLVWGLLKMIKNTYDFIKK